MNLFVSAIYTYASDIHKYVSPLIYFVLELIYIDRVVIEKAGKERDDSQEKAEGKENKGKNRR